MVDIYSGFVLVSTAPTKEREIYTKLDKVANVKEVHPLFGEYDALVKIVAEDPETIAKIIIDDIRSIDGITDTKTLTGPKINMKSGLEKNLNK